MVSDDKAKILVCDDLAENLLSYQAILDELGQELVLVRSGEEALKEILKHDFAVILLDVNMPGMDGLETASLIRQRKRSAHTPIIFITAKDDTKDVVRGLEMGADDYIVKPYDNDELIARVRAHLRRAPKPNMSEEMVFNGGEFRINFMNREVRVRNELKHLTPKEFNLLAVLVRNAGRVVPRTELVTEAWGEEYADAIDSLKLYIHYLRQKVELDAEHPDYILTSRGVGYRFANR